MSRKNHIFLWFFGILGLFTLVPGTIDKATYFYFRTHNGSTIQANNQCIKIPPGWVVDSTEDDDGYTVIDLRRKAATDYQFASVIIGANSIKDSLKNLSPLKEVQGMYSIYEIEGLARTNTVRYWSTFSNQAFILMGRDVEVLDELSTFKWSKDC